MVCRSLAAALDVVAALRPLDGVGREELAHREGDVPEQSAGVLAAVAAGALLVGHTVVVDGHQQLGVPLQPDDGELAQGHIDPSAVVPAGQLPAEAVAHEGGDFTQVAVAVPLAAAVHDAGVQHDGVHGLHHGDGRVGPLHHLGIRLSGPHLGGEDLGVPLAAEQDGPLVKDAQALHRHRHRAAEIGLERHMVEEAHIHGVEAPVEADRLHIHIDVQQLGAAALHGQGAVDDVHTLQLGVKPQVLDAVLIAAGIKNLPGMDANRLPDAAGVLHGTGHNFLGHCNTS